jgi:hypothetical protein
MKISGLAKNGGVVPEVLIAEGLVEEGPFESENLKGASG